MDNLDDICHIKQGTIPLEPFIINFSENQCVAHNVSLEQKIGAMIIMGFKGVEVNEPIVQTVIHYLREELLGGTILYKDNIDSPEQLKALTKALYNANQNIFIATDQEGGKVQRLSPDQGFKGFPSAYSVTHNYTLDQVILIYETLAKELFDHGINLNLAPVADLDSKNSIIGSRERSFGEKVETVVEYAGIFIDAHHKYNIATALKHFPGHGLAVGDTHKGMVDITDTAKAKELEPFYKLIDEQKVDIIMTAHVLNRFIDSKYPATLSPIIITELLRNKGYNGIIITDDLLMGAIIKEYSFAESVILSINAGSDLLLISNNIAACKGISDCKADYDIPLIIAKIIKEAISQGKISINRINESYNRILDLKQRFIN